MFNILQRISSVFLLRSFVVLAMAPMSIASDNEEGQLQVYRLKETNFSTSLEDWVVKSTYDSIQRIVSGSPLDLVVLGIPIAKQVCEWTPKLTASSGNVIYDGWESRPKLVAASMGIGAIAGAVGGWFVGKGINTLIDSTIEHAIEVAAGEAGNISVGVPPGATTAFLAARKLYNHKDEIRAGVTAVGAVFGLVGGGVAASYAVLPKKQFSAAWNRGWTRENYVYSAVRGIREKRFDSRLWKEPSMEDMKAAMFYMDKVKAGVYS